MRTYYTYIGRDRNKAVKQSLQIVGHTDLREGAWGEETKSGGEPFFYREPTGHAGTVQQFLSPAGSIQRIPVIFVLQRTGIVIDVVHVQSVSATCGFPEWSQKGGRRRYRVG